MNKFRVMTFNMKNDSPFTTKIKNFNSRKNAIVSIIRSYNPDIIGVQELSLPMKSELKKLLNDYEFYGNCRDNKLSRYNEHTDILVLKNKFEVKEYKTFWLSDTPTIAGSKFSFALFPRICTYTTIKALNSDYMCRIFNSHLDPILEYSRIKQLSKLLMEINKYQKTDPLPTILMGDFNCHNFGKVSSIIKSNTYKFQSVYESKPYFNTLHFSLGKVFSNKSPIDYIYASSDLCLVDYKIITNSYNNIYPSDHFPVIADFIIHP